MNRDRLLADAKARALALVEGYKPPEPLDAATARVRQARWRCGWRRRVSTSVGIATDHDLVVASGAGRGAERAAMPT